MWASCYLGGWLPAACEGLSLRRARARGVTCGILALPYRQNRLRVPARWQGEPRKHRTGMRRAAAVGLVLVRQRRVRTGHGSDS